MTKSGEGFRVAAVQTVSGGDVETNLAQAEPLIGQAAAEGARLVVLPEYFGIFGARATDKLAVRETDDGGAQQAFLARLAKAHAIWLVGGTVPLASADPARVRSACLVYGPDGRRVARYDKMHLFAFTRGDERYDEGKTIEPGTEVVTVDLPCGRVGLSVCYDLRFPELYRGMGTLALILVPSAFTATTGAAHWHLLLRARAVENQCYVLAAAQGGAHPGGRRTYGHSLLIDPWGTVVAELGEGSGIVVGDVDPARLAEVRAQLPALSHRVLHAPGSHRMATRSNARSTDRHFEDFVPGLVSEFGPISVDGADVVAFARRYDPQSVHIDPEVAAAGPFGGLIASGWHTASLVMRLLVEHYLVRGGALASPGIDELRWLHPVRPGDALRVRVTVLEARRSRSKPDRGLVRTRIEAFNQDGAAVMSMIAMNLFLCRAPGTDEGAGPAD